MHDAQMSIACSLLLWLFLHAQHAYFVIQPLDDMALIVVSRIQGGVRVDHSCITVHYFLRPWSRIHFPAVYLILSGSEVSVEHIRSKHFPHRHTQACRRCSHDCSFSPLRTRHVPETAQVALTLLRMGSRQKSVTCSRLSPPGSKTHLAATLVNS